MAHLIENNADAPILKVRSISRDPRSRRRLRKLAKPEPWTTGYSGEGQERAYRQAQSGRIRVNDD